MAWVVERMVFTITPRHAIRDRSGVSDTKSVSRTSQYSRIPDSDYPNETTYQIRRTGLQFALGGV
ncbi:hypothetical protein N7489_008498 [Penicillium chrysogenum]|uniref:Uncharacterized protein n=1 Tax=Penicillium chrysogenum TaxID=5076 RepID=A0ABQ8X034_PENCH|nr:uncharacterized protein N7489_008498 [Penicillium chrysogenum]KAJ5227790.1 hypothetical protein N7489_008498 [Penicillium chrysogenum]KAJ5284574.1 hypothetical protein N7505_002554 [Penicillium chrysogenum]KAJ5286483.1 hypothetical protein N7524_001789 [Penicillium chrysogenum]KAJ6167293.1 hypothetical protein N7497_000136 [Penicillium chrysogenum]